MKLFDNKLAKIEYNAYIYSLSLLLHSKNFIFLYRGRIIEKSMIFDSLGVNRAVCEFSVVVVVPGGHFNFVCTGVCGHTIGKLTHPQTSWPIDKQKQTHSQTTYNKI